MDRREFLRNSALAGAAAAFPSSSILPSQAGPPSDRLRLGFLGMGARAHQLVDAVQSLPNAEIVALCDSYTGRAARGRARTNGRAAIVDDYRRILDDRGIDAVFIVTPDHWHRQMALDALGAGKDVYIEKPMTYAIDEGLEIVQSVDRHKRILQVGSQGVSSAQETKGRELVKSGKLGQITLVRAAFHRNTAGGAWLYPIPPDASERTVNWAQFLGPAPKRPFSLERFFRWRCYWDYSGGIATDLFVHLVTTIHYVMDVAMPDRVFASGATYRWKDTHEVPDTINAVLTYPQGFTVTLACTLNSAEHESGVDVLGTQGNLRFRGNSVQFVAESPQEDNRWVVRSWPEALEQAYYADPKVQAAETPDTWRQRAVGQSEQWGTTGEDDTVAHIRGFFDAVRTRKQPVEDARAGHRAAACAHMVNRSIRTGQVVEWDPARDTIKT
jgi:predicted dehydrogenase